MIKKAYTNFVNEAEMFFVTKFINSGKIEQEYSTCLDIIFGLSGKYDSGRGIIAFNQKYGQGKSFFFEVMNHRYKRRNNGKNFFKRVTAKDLVQIYLSAKKGEDPIEKLTEAISVKRLFIDDIGDEGENKIFKHYANELNVLRFVLLKRYELWIEKGWLTYGTTNLTIEQIASNYDGRVSDRILQMCYWREFKFLGTGSFRQVEETRKLTQEEIQNSWDKLKVEKPIEKIDLEKYFNELIEEPVEFFSGKDNLFWTFVKDYLLRKELLKTKDFDNISEEEIQNANMVLQEQIRDSNRFLYKHAPADVRQLHTEKALEQITRNDMIKYCENMIARKRLLELKNEKHNFV